MLGEFIARQGLRPRQYNIETAVLPAVPGWSIRNFADALLRRSHHTGGGPL